MVMLHDRPPIAFDVLSVDIGITPSKAIPGSSSVATPVKPISGYAHCATQHAPMYPYCSCSLHAQRHVITYCSALCA